MKSLVKLVLPIIVLLFLGLIGFAYQRITREREVLLDDLDRRARVIGKSLAVGAIRAIKHPPTPDEENLAERFSGQGRTMGLMVCGHEGKLVARSAALADLAACDAPEVQEIFAGNTEKIHFFEKKGQTLHLLISPLEDRDGDFLGTLTIVHEASYIDKRVMSAVTWTTLSLAVLAIFISTLTYFLSRRSFQKSVQQVLAWMKAAKEPTEPLPPPTESLLKPVTREVEKLTARLRAARETAREVSEERQVSDLWTPARLKAHVTSRLGNRPLIVVSKQEPYVHVREHGNMRVTLPASGLVRAIDPILRAVSGLWIAHGTGEETLEGVDAEGKLLVPPEAPSYTLKKIWLTRKEEEGYYYGFCQEALSPLFHLIHHRPNFNENDWQHYIRVNQKFADSIVKECGMSRNPCVLVQDYHLTLLPKFIREKLPNATIAIFWHIPWPMPESFHICPWKREILAGMLEANFVGFNLQTYCNNFLDTVNSLLRVRIDWDRFAILHKTGSTTVKSLPVGIPSWSERQVVASEKSFREKEKFLRHELEVSDLRLAVSVDRIDHTKGISERMVAIDHFLDRCPEYRGKVAFIQLAAPSGSHTPRRRELLLEIENFVDQINWKHGTEVYKPIIFLKANHGPETVYTFLRMADVCIVSSLSDSMNLVAKEFVAAREKADGVLILSEFAGASREFNEALQFNPYFKSDFAEAIRIALEMPPAEQQRRMMRLKAHVAENNVYKWAAGLIGELVHAAEEIPTEKPKTAARS